MKKIKYFIALSVLLISAGSYGQVFNQTKILGSWKCERIEFLTLMKDSANMVKNAINMTISFEPGNKAVIKNQRDSTEKVRNTTYSISADGKTLTQNHVDSQIMKLTDKELVLKVEEDGIFIAYFKKVVPTN